jgi:alpha-mannosidase
VKDSVVSLTLIKCGVEPNQNTDVEMHYFTYALYPHAEDWRRGGTVQEGYKLNLPMYAVNGGEAGKCYSFASVEQNNVILETVKQAESGEGTVLRLYEAHNARTKATVKLPEGVKAAYITNLLEEIEEELPVKDGKITFTVKPYEIMTILLK